MCLDFMGFLYYESFLKLGIVFVCLVYIVLILCYVCGCLINI